VDVVTHCDELQVDKVNRTEEEVVTHCKELQVNKADRNEVVHDQQGTINKNIAVSTI
jgi:hypothetical protein